MLCKHQGHCTNTRYYCCVLLPSYSLWEEDTLGTPAICAAYPFSFTSPHCHGSELDIPGPGEELCPHLSTAQNCVALKQLISHFLTSVLVSVELRSLQSQGRLHPWLSLHWSGLWQCSWKKLNWPARIYTLWSLTLLPWNLFFSKAFQTHTIFFNISSSIESASFEIFLSILQSCKKEVSVYDW